MEFESAARYRSKSISLTADDPVTAAQGRDYVRRARIGTRARRGGGRDRIHQSLQVVDTAYHAAGSTAIFEENPFERRFRDIHTVSQQLQGRSEHFETVGQYLIGLALDSLMWL